MLDPDETSIIQQLSEAIRQQIPVWFGEQASLVRLEPIQIRLPIRVPNLFSKKGNE